MRKYKKEIQLENEENGYEDLGWNYHEDKRELTSKKLCSVLKRRLEKEILRFEYWDRDNKDKGLVLRNNNKQNSSDYTEYRMYDSLIIGSLRTLEDTLAYIEAINKEIIQSE